MNGIGIGMETTKWLEGRLRQLAQRQQELDQELRRTLPPGKREDIYTEKTLVDTEINHTHKQLAYVQRGYRLR